MARTMDLIFTDPGMLMRRMFRDIDQVPEPRGWPFAGLRKPPGDFPWTPEFEMKQDTVKASFKESVLEITVPLPAVAATTTHTVAVEGEPKKKSVAAAA